MSSACTKSCGWSGLGGRQTDLVEGIILLERSPHRPAGKAESVVLIFFLPQASWSFLVPREKPYVISTCVSFLCPTELTFGALQFSM